MSKLEDLMPAEELLFDATPGFGKKYKPFLAQAIAHPAKMNTRLTEFLIENFTKQGDVILDPMSGSGQTGVVAALLGRNAVCIELEEKFYKWQLEAKAKLEDAQTLRAKGKMACVLGDARALSQLMQKTGVAMTPYSGSATGNLPETERCAERLVEHGYDPGEFLGGKAKNTVVEWRYASRENKQNRGNLSRGEIDAVISSPPYADSKKQPQGVNLEHEVSSMETDTRSDTQNRHTPGRVKAIESLLSGYGESDANIGNLPVGEIDCVLTSPPYADGTKGPSREVFWNRLANDPASNRYGRKKHPTTGEGYGRSDNNIGNLIHGSMDTAITSPPEVDAVITSPPYAETNIKKQFKNEKELEKFAKGQYVFKHGRSLEATKRYMKKSWQGYPENEKNIGNLSHGNVDTVITSPPYSEGIGHVAGENASGKHKDRLDMQRKQTEQMVSEGNIAKLKHGEVDAIVTSPPYVESKPFHDLEFMKRTSKEQSEKVKKGENKGHCMTEEARRKVFERMEEGKTENPENISNMLFKADAACTHGEIDTVITSPPYEASLEGTTRHTRGGIASRDPALAQTGTYATTLSKATKHGVPVGYSPNKENIGNLKKETYLEAMAKVYVEAWKVLKPRGKAIIVIKPFIRNKKVVDLPFHTWLLMEKVGFKLVKLHKLRLKTESFWRLLYSKKYPDVPKIAHEYIIIAQKGK